MKHTIRQRVINEFGLPTVKLTTVYGELGSGMLDKNGKEIFEGDRVKNRWGEVENVKISAGTFLLDKCLRDLCEFYDTELEIVGHAEAKK